MSGRDAHAVSGRPTHAAGKPAWLRVRLPAPAPFRATAGLLDELELHTVCHEARCPNRGECFASGTATFLILGDTCTRGCGFCAIGRAPARPAAPDGDEPRRVAAAAGPARPAPRGRDERHPRRPGRRRGGPLRRDDRRPARGAAGGDGRGAGARLSAGGRRPCGPCSPPRPDVLAHNLETVPRLYGEARRGARTDVAGAAAAGGGRRAAGAWRQARGRRSTGESADGPPSSRPASCWASARPPARSPPSLPTVPRPAPTWSPWGST